jgi:drug/metabolite transporter (DMT)-like permease
LQTGNKNKAYLALTATSIIWGTTWVASRIGVEDVPGLQVSYLRQFIAGCLLLLFFFIRGESFQHGNSFAGYSFFPFLCLCLQMVLAHGV